MKRSIASAENRTRLFWITVYIAIIAGLTLGAYIWRH